MINKDEYLIPFQLISIAGNARSIAINAVKKAQSNEFEEAQKLIIDAENEMNNAHQIQTDMLVNESRGDKNSVNIILIHAMDHMAMALQAIDYAKDTVYLYQKLALIQNNIDK